MILAHGLGGRSDLPVPLWLAVYGAAAAVLFSFVALNALRSSRPGAAGDGRPLAEHWQRLLDSRAALVLLRALGLLAWALVMAAAWLGPEDVGQNPAPTWFYVWFWVGLLPLSLALGPVVRAISPLRTLAAALGQRWARPLPRWIGYWPAVAGLAGFLWLELVYDAGSDPRMIGLFLTVYTVVHVVAGAAFGPDWFDRAEGFEAYSDVVGRLSVLGRRDDGTWMLRNPMEGLARLKPAPGLVALACLLLGSTAFDGISRTGAWKDLVRSLDRTEYHLVGTLGLLAAVVLVAAVYEGAVLLTGRYATDRFGLGDAFAPSLVPVACGYTVAHYFSFAVFQGQAGLILGSDPLGLGWDLFGMRDARVDYTVVSAQAIAVVQVVAIVTGHVLGVLAAHDRAMTLFPMRNARTGQYPLLVAMIGFTMAGIALLLGT